jgi:hypothetical protein
METVSIVIAEHGANWLHWARALGRKAGAFLLLAQDPGEAPAEFAQRVSRRIARLDREGQSVAHAAFVAGQGWSPSDGSHRSTILHRLSSVLARSGREATLYLDPAGPPAGPSGVVMRALAWAIGDLVKGRDLHISVGAAPPVELAPC